MSGGDPADADPEETTEEDMRRLCHPHAVPQRLPTPGEKRGFPDLAVRSTLNHKANTSARLEGDVAMSHELEETTNPGATPQVADSVPGNAALSPGTGQALITQTTSAGHRRGDAGRRTRALLGG